MHNKTVSGSIKLIVPKEEEKKTQKESLKSECEGERWLMVLKIKLSNTAFISCSPSKESRTWGLVIVFSPHVSEGPFPLHGVGALAVLK